MDPKPRHNRRIYLAILRQMTPEQRLNKTFELSEFTRELYRHGLRERFPHLSASEFHKRYLEQLAKCYNRNY